MANSKGQPFNSGGQVGHSSLIASPLLSHAWNVLCVSFAAGTQLARLCQDLELLETVGQSWLFTQFLESKDQSG